MLEIGERLKTIRGSESQEAFAARFGVHRNTLARWESGERTPDLEFLVRLVRERGVAPEWVLTGGGGMQASATPPACACDVDLMSVPLVEARLSAGTGSFETGGTVERRYAFRTEFLLRKGQPASMVLMRVDGDSMEPEIHDGDVVLIDQSQTMPRAGAMFAVSVEGLVYIKMVDAKPGKFVLKSLNADYEQLEIDARGDLADGIRIIGKAIWLGREMR
jgi:phage repressor protein C with HTH and peptisase S24 domain